MQPNGSPTIRVCLLIFFLYRSWKEGEINLTVSGLSGVVVIAGGETMIALTYECLLCSATARSCAQMHAHRCTHWHPSNVNVIKYSPRMGKLRTPMQPNCYERGILPHFSYFTNVAWRERLLKADQAWWGEHTLPITQSLYGRQPLCEEMSRMEDTAHVGFPLFLNFSLFCVLFPALVDTK